MSTPSEHWARQAATVHRANGNAADFVVTSVDGLGTATTYVNCKQSARSVWVTDPSGARISLPMTVVSVPRADGATEPTKGDLGSCNGGTRFTIGAVKVNAGTWIVESLGR